MLLTDMFIPSAQRDQTAETQRAQRRKISKTL
jgi:hypothetical protein